MKKIFIILISASYFFMTSCDLLLNPGDSGLSTEEVVSGLKTALSAGTDSSTIILHATDGYFKGGAALKILLPPQADPIFNYVAAHPLIQSILQPKIDQVILSINRSAEDAASAAKPIFLNAITNMSVTDGLNILNGKTVGVASFDSTAATIYLQSKTTTELTAAFSPYIDASLNKKLVGNMTTNQIWSDLITTYNALVSSNQQITGTLGEYATRRALEGMFLKVGTVEKKIRKDPA